MVDTEINDIKEVDASSTDFFSEGLAIKVEEARTGTDAIKCTDLVKGI